MIRAANEHELTHLQDIERAAGEMFRDLDMQAVADDEPPAIDELRRFQLDGDAWVYADDNDHAVGYMLVDTVDGWLYIKQVSVHPGCGRRGLGRQLIDFADSLAAERRLDGLTLTTYLEVPWNCPYYERLGFRPVAEDLLSDGMRAIREEERSRGLDVWPRLVMARAAVA